jgi:dipeptidyl aminopeptidase/acylaminoacyl peptidase
VIREWLWETVLGLPPDIQESILDLSLGLVAPGKLGHMIASTFVCFGADYQEVDHTVRRSKSLSDLAGRFSDLGERWEEIGKIARAAGHSVTARHAYQRAAVYYGVEAWAASVPGQLRDAYIDIRRCYQAFCELDETVIERVEVPLSPNADAVESSGPPSPPPSWGRPTGQEGRAGGGAAEQNVEDEVEQEPKISPVSPSTRPSADLPHKGGGDRSSGAALPGFLRLPKGRRKVPCVVLVQGFDTIKEWMTPITAMAAERGMATLNVDLPGHGEALLRGLPLLTGPDEARAVGEALCRFLQGHPRISKDRIGVFGFSLGGYMAAQMASSVEEVGACAILGAPYDFGFLDRCSPVMLRRASFATGVDSVETIKRATCGSSLKGSLPALRGPLLVVHGEDDEIVPLRHAELIHHYARCPKELKVFERADHMVSRALMTEALPLVFDWMGDALHQKRRRA